MNEENIVIGTTVRSFDFDRHRSLTGEHSCYIEGIVTDVDVENECYNIDVFIDVFGGKTMVDGSKGSRVGSNIMAPFNGLDSFVGVTSGVVII
jgi:hypothetical protein